MPTFRGEEADERHLCQFYHSEAEIPGNLNDVMDLVEEYIKHLSRKIIEEFGEVLQHELGDITHIKKVANYKGKFPRITFDDAEKKLKEKFPDKIDRFIIYDDGFRNITSDGEKALMQIYDGLIWVTNYDKMAVPFYQKVDEKNKRSVNSF